MTSITICTFNVENLFGRYKVLGYLPGDKFKKISLLPKNSKKKVDSFRARYMPLKTPFRYLTKNSGGS